MDTHVSLEKTKFEKLKRIFRGKRMKIADLEEKNKKLMNIIANAKTDRWQHRSSAQVGANLPTLSVNVPKQANQSHDLSLSMTHSHSPAALSPFHLPNNSFHKQSSSTLLGQALNANSYMSFVENQSFYGNNVNTSQSKEMINHRGTFHQLHQNQTPSGHLSRGMHLNDQTNHVVATNSSNVKGSTVQQEFPEVPGSDLVSNRYHPHQIHGSASNLWNPHPPPPYHYPMKENHFQQNLAQLATHHRSQSNIQQPPQSAIPHNSYSTFYPHPKQQFRDPQLYPHTYNSFMNCSFPYTSSQVHKDFRESLYQKDQRSFMLTQKNHSETGNDQQLHHSYETSTASQSSVRSTQPSKNLQDSSSITNQKQKQITNIRRESTRNTLSRLCDSSKIPSKSANEKEYETPIEKEHTSTEVLHLIGHKSLPVKEFTAEIKRKGISSSPVENRTLTRYDGNHHTDPGTFTKPDVSIVTVSSQTNCPMPMVLSPPLTPPATSTIIPSSISLNFNQSQALLPSHSKESLSVLQKYELSNQDTLGLQKNSLGMSKAVNFSMTHSEDLMKCICEDDPIPSPPEVVIYSDQPSNSNSLVDPDNSVKTTPELQTSLCAETSNLTSSCSSSIPSSHNTDTLNLTIQPKSSHDAPTFALSKLEYPQDCIKEEFSTGLKESDKSTVPYNSSDNEKIPFHEKVSNKQSQMTSSSVSQAGTSHECDNTMAKSLLPSSSNSAVTPLSGIGEPCNVFVSKTYVPNSSAVSVSCNSTAKSMAAASVINIASSLPCTDASTIYHNHAISEVPGSSATVNFANSEKHADKKYEMVSNEKCFNLNPNLYHEERKIKPIIVNNKSISFPENLNVCCYACKSDNVKSSDMEFHLFFGNLKCENCDYRIANCQDLKGVKSSDMKCFQNNLHKFSVWTLNPIDFLTYHLWQVQKENRKPQLCESKMQKLYNYLETLRPLKNTEPWGSALSRCTKYALVMLDSYKSNSSKDCENSSKNIRGPFLKNDDEAPQPFLASSLTFKQTADRNKTKIPQTNKELGQLSETEFDIKITDNLLNPKQPSMVKVTSLPVKNAVARTDFLDCEKNVSLESKIPNSDGTSTSCSIIMMEDIPVSPDISSTSGWTDSEYIMKDSCSLKILEEIMEYVPIYDVTDQIKENSISEQLEIKDKEMSDTRDESYALDSLDKREGSVLDKVNLNSVAKNEEVNFSPEVSEIKGKSNFPQLSQTDLPLQNQLLQDNHLIIPLKTDGESGILLMDQVPEECPLCYAPLYPSQFTINVKKYEMTTKCDCNLKISLTFGEVTLFEHKTSYKRPGPKSKTVCFTMKRQKFRD